MKTPDFAIFQHDRRKQSAVWIKEKGEWTLSAKYNIGKKVTKKEPSTSEVLAKGFAEEQEARKKEEEEDAEGNKIE